MKRTITYTFAIFAIVFMSASANDSGEHVGARFTGVFTNSAVGDYHGYKEALMITAEVESDSAMSVMVSATLVRRRTNDTPVLDARSGDQSMIVCDSGKTTFELTFDWRVIRRARDDGPFTIRLWLGYEDPECVAARSPISSYSCYMPCDSAIITTSDYSFTDFRRPPIELLDAVADYGVDLNGDGLFDELVVTVPVNAGDSGHYWVRCELIGKNQDIPAQKTCHRISAGTDTIKFAFDGKSVGRAIGRDKLFVEIESLWEIRSYQLSDYSATHFPETP